MNEPTEQEINEGLARFEGWEYRDNIESHPHFPGGYKEVKVKRWFTSNGLFAMPANGVPTYTASLDDCRRVMATFGTRNQDKLEHALFEAWKLELGITVARFSRANVKDFLHWLLFTMPPATLARAIWEVVK